LCDPLGIWILRISPAIFVRGMTLASFCGQETISISGCFFERSFLLWLRYLPQICNHQRFGWGGGGVFCLRVGGGFAGRGPYFVWGGGWGGGGGCGSSNSRLVRIKAPSCESNAIKPFFFFLSSGPLFSNRFSAYPR